MDGNIFLMNEPCTNSQPRSTIEENEWTVELFMQLQQKMFTKIRGQWMFDDLEHTPISVRIMSVVLQCSPAGGTSTFAEKWAHTPVHWLHVLPETRNTPIRIGQKHTALQTERSPTLTAHRIISTLKTGYNSLMAIYYAVAQHCHLVDIFKISHFTKVLYCMQVTDFEKVLKQTRLLKQWSRKSSRTVCSRSDRPSSSPVRQASVTRLKK